MIMFSGFAHHSINTGKGRKYNILRLKKFATTTKNKKSRGYMFPFVSAQSHYTDLAAHVPLNY